MKERFKKFTGAVAAVAVLVAATVPLSAADILRDIGPFNAVDSTKGQINSLATNGFYPPALLQTVNSGGVTNAVLIQTLPGKDTALQFWATPTNSTTTNIVFNIWASVVTPAFTNVTANAASGLQPGDVFNGNGKWSPWLQVVLAVGQTAGVVATTNVVLSTATTPPDGAMPYLYVYSINVTNNGAGGTGAVTNYGVAYLNQ